MNQVPRFVSKTGEVHMFGLLLMVTLHDPMLGAHGWKYVSHQGVRARVCVRAKTLNPRLRVRQIGLLPAVTTPPTCTGP